MAKAARGKKPAKPRQPRRKRAVLEIEDPISGPCDNCLRMEALELAKELNAGKTITLKQLLRDACEIFAFVKSGVTIPESPNLKVPDPKTTARYLGDEGGQMPSFNGDNEEKHKSKFDEITM